MHGAFRATEVTRSKPAKLRPLRPNIGLAIAYQKKIDRLIQEMQASVVYWIKAAYRENPPATMALDDILPANALKRAIARLKKRWLKQFDEAAPRLAAYFAKAVNQRTDASLKSILRDGGFSVRFVQTQAMKDVVAATITENVSLIKSIASQHLGEVEQLVMRSVSRGRDLGYLSKELQARYGITKRRAAFISRSQNNLSSSAMERVRQQELGVVQAKWRHSRASKVPRPSHIANDGKLYSVKTGWWDPAIKKFTWPGVEPGCKCVSISVIPGFS